MDELEILFEIGTKSKKLVDLSEWKFVSFHILHKGSFEAFFRSYCKFNKIDRNLVFRYIDDDKKVIGATTFYSTKLKSDFILFNFNNIPLIHSYYYTLTRLMYINNFTKITSTIGDVESGFKNTDYIYSLEDKQISYDKVSSNNYYRSLAELLSFMSLQFLFLHEVGHALNGHTKFRGSQTYNDLLKNNDISEDIVLKTLEMDADAYAAGSLANFISNTNFSDFVDLYPCVKMLTRNDITDLCVFAIYTAFVCSSRYVMTKKHYLSPRMRSLLCIDVLVSEFSQLKKEKFNRDRLNKLILVADSNYSIISKTDGINFEIIDNLLEEDLEYKVVLRETWKNTLRHALSQFSEEELAK